MESYMSKIKSLEEAKKAREEVSASGGRVVFTNGCFDLLHPGHTRYLHLSRQLGDHLIVAVNSNRSVRSIKGPKRPVYDEQVRAELVASLQCVDTVVIFDEDNPLRVIEYILPDILVKGGDWLEQDIIGADVVRAAGGEVRNIAFVSGFSTTGTIEKILALQKE
jgi:D-beta-D-heptose 7-phosphate kinase/D-beta-D-heptose 1-phosphate adenosyltransferase